MAAHSRIGGFALPVLAAALAGSLFWLPDLPGVLELGLDRWHGQHQILLDFIRDHPITATLAVFLLHTLLAALALPGASLLMLAAGSGFGALFGTLLCLTGCTTGATLSMLASRRWLRTSVRRRYGRLLAEFDARIAADGPAYLFSLRLLPVLPFAVVNVAGGLSTMKAWTFFWISLAGMAAGTFVYVNAGTQLRQVRTPGDLYTAQVLASLAALALLPWLLKPFARRIRTDGSS